MLPHKRLGVLVSSVGINLEKQVVRMQDLAGRWGGRGGMPSWPRSGSGSATTEASPGRHHVEILQAIDRRTA